MQSEFIILKLTRKNMVELLDQFSVKQINAIPKKMKNNLIWNAAHSLVTQQLLCYYLSGLPLKIDHFWVDHFKKGTAPEERYNDKVIEELKSLLIDTAKELESDYQKGVFIDYQDYMTSFGFNLQNIEEAIQFNNTHEALHYGYSLAIKNEI